ncbi:AGAP006865-PA-like protein [Anopheles sinensis]|uniref:AGAP006865-PA-like protein n=1 Tax=Anopheles sinensis TaxID=74873 RepID=A0A084W6C1_ANOSI|nr:AGAP006865-PA-like protein [Anopheles sinensis]
MLKIFVSCFVLVAVATAAYVPSGKGYPSSKVAARKIFHHAPADDEVKSEPEHHHPHHKEEEHDHFVDFYAPINYKFEYGVKDPHTGDHKTHWEERDGEVVRGAYTILDADGSSRLVEYTADPHHGFNAVVKKIEHPHVPPAANCPSYLNEWL